MFLIQIVNKLIGRVSNDRLKACILFYYTSPPTNMSIIEFMAIRRYFSHFFCFQVIYLQCFSCPCVQNSTLHSHFGSGLSCVNVGPRYVVNILSTEYGIDQEHQERLLYARIASSFDFCHRALTTSSFSPFNLMPNRSLCCCGAQ